MKTQGKGHKMIALDTTQVATLAEGWGYEVDDVDAAVCMADAMGMDLVTFVAQIDEIRAGLEAGGCLDHPGNSASYLMYCTARLAAGLPLE